MNIPSAVASVAVFGSLARGDRDHMSDRDILLVSDDARVRRSSAEQLRFAGWSPVAFTWKRLHEAGARKGLFIQHLKLEARILKDQDSRLRGVLSDFFPRSEYQKELSDSQQLLSVIEAIPNSVKGRYWALDVLAVGFRSLAVAVLANNGLYRFSQRSILGGLCEIGVLKSGDIEPLRRMREFKWRHRKGKFEQCISWNETQRLIDLVSRRFRLGLNVRPIEADDALAIVVNESGESDNWYLRSRLLERAILGIRPRCNAEPETLHSIRSLLHTLREPSQYGWRVKRRWEAMKEEVLMASHCSDIRF